MPISSVITAVAVLAAAVLGVEGVNIATGGEMYLANIEHLAQAEAQVPPPERPPEPSPPPFTQPTDEQPPPFGQPPFQSGTEQPPFGQPPFPGRTGQPPHGQFGPTPGEPFRSGEPGQQFFGPGQPGEPPFPGQPGQDGQPGQFQREGQPQGKQPFFGQEQPKGQFEKGQPLFSGEDHPFEFEEESFEEPINYEGLKNAVNEIKRMLADLRRWARSAGQFSSRVSELISELTNIQSTLSNQSSDAETINETLRSFWDERYWEKLDEIRTFIEAPRQIKDWQRGNKRLKSILNTKAVQNIGLNIASAKQTAALIDEHLGRMQSALSSGSAEELRELLQEVYEGEVPDPNQIQGFIMQYRDIARRLKSLKNRDLRSQIQQALQEPVEEFNSGNYREAWENFNEIQNSIFQALNRSIRRR